MVYVCSDHNKGDERTNKGRLYLICKEWGLGFIDIRSKQCFGHFTGTIFVIVIITAGWNLDLQLRHYRQTIIFSNKTVVLLYANLYPVACY